jgi:glycosyltransferase involved in cell wall biosynthesis
LGISFSLRPHAFDIFSRNRRDTRVQLENASKVITISNYNRNYIANLCPRLKPEDIEVVYCGMETNTMQPAPKRAPNRPLRILSIGRPAEKKGLEYLIDACALLAERGIPFHCDIVVGKWSQYQFWQRRKTDLQQRGEALKAQIKRLGLEDSITLLGDQDQKGILQLYHQSDVFALPCVVARSGDRDGIPGVLQEAMACAMPVVTTPVTGIPELVVNGETGLLAPERDAEALADALQLLLADEGLRQKLGQQARVKVLQDYEIQRNMAQLAAILKRFSDQAEAHGLAPSGVLKKVAQ